MAYILKKSELKEKLISWSEDSQVWLPLKRENFSRFEHFTPTAELALESPHNTRVPPKELFLPQSEVLLKYRPGGAAEAAKLLQETRIVFGIHPCDTKAITLLDTIFDTQENNDPYWKARRENTILIGLGCAEPCPTCFCTTVESGPFGSSGMDAIATDLGDSYHLRTIGSRASKFLKDLPASSPEQDALAKEIQQRALNSISKAFEVADLKIKLDNNFESAYWQQVSISCLGCGVCTFLCPTCFCFDIVDEAQRSERVRNWDTCMFNVYSLETSGHNPRPTKRERTRQRVMHKFSYWLDHVGKIGCTGCGRCVRYCPVGLDIRAMLRAANELPLETNHAQ